MDEWCTCAGAITGAQTAHTAHANTVQYTLLLQMYYTNTRSQKYKTSLVPRAQGPSAGASVEVQAEVGANLW